MAQQNIPIEQMDFKALRAKVQEQEDSLARLKRILEDALQNIDFDNFSRCVDTADTAIRLIWKLGTAKLNDTE